MTVSRCPCGTGLPYAECCGPFHAGGRAATAEHLMRSRFSAFASGDADYLARTWHPTTRPAHLDLDPELRWYRLEVLRTERGGLLEADGVVEFRADYRAPSGPGSLHEVSRFVRDGGVWLYLDGAASTELVADKGGTAAMISATDPRSRRRGRGPGG